MSSERTYTTADVKAFSLRNSTIRKAIFNMVDMRSVRKLASENGHTDELSQIDAFIDSDEKNPEKVLGLLLDLYLEHPKVQKGIATSAFKNLMDKEAERQEELATAATDAQKAFDKVKHKDEVTVTEETIVEEGGEKFYESPVTHEDNLKSAAESDDPDLHEYVRKTRYFQKKDAQEQHLNQIDESELEQRVRFFKGGVVQPLIASYGSKVDVLKNSSRVKAYVLAKIDGKLTESVQKAIDKLPNKNISLSKLVKIILENDKDLAEQLSKDPEFIKIVEEEDKRIRASSPDYTKALLSHRSEMSQINARLKELENIEAPTTQDEAEFRQLSEKKEQLQQNWQRLENSAAHQLAELHFPDLFKEIEEIIAKIQAVHEEIDALNIIAEDLKKNPLLKKKEADLSDTEKEEVKTIQLRLTNIGRRIYHKKSEIATHTKEVLSLYSIVLDKGADILKAMKDQEVTPQHAGGLEDNELRKRVRNGLISGEALSTEDKSQLNAATQQKASAPELNVEITDEDREKAQEKLPKENNGDDVDVKKYLALLVDGGKGTNESREELFDKFGQKGFASLVIAKLMELLKEEYNFYLHKGSTNKVQETLRKIAQVKVIAAKLEQDPSCAKYGANLLEEITDIELEDALAPLKPLGDLDDDTVDHNEIYTEHFQKPVEKSISTLVQDSKHLDQKASLNADIKRPASQEDAEYEMTDGGMIEALKAAFKDENTTEILAEIVKIYKFYEHMRITGDEEEKEVALAAMVKLNSISSQISMAQDTSAISRILEDFTKSFDEERETQQISEKAKEKGITKADYLKRQMRKHTDASVEKHLKTDEVSPELNQEVAALLGYSVEQWTDIQEGHTPSSDTAPDTPALEVDIDKD